MSTNTLTLHDIERISHDLRERHTVTGHMLQGGYSHNDVARLLSAIVARLDSKELLEEQAARATQVDDSAVKFSWCIQRHMCLDEPRFWDNMTRAEMEAELATMSNELGDTGWNVFRLGTADRYVVAPARVVRK